MIEPFILPVVYQGTEHEFKARFERLGYTHRILVLIGEDTVTFEPDEEGQYRALASGAVDPGILRMVAEKLVQLSD
ncbi:hypothetical protein ACFFGT_04965 [Mucilaginibacter angelicae]|uniref:Uncharacterized protein n=1 Tax=Mucilaginibacter angelicae TaxID=869718 RepID=A0ABV6L1D0_9SPHI